MRNRFCIGESPFVFVYKLKVFVVFLPSPQWRSAECSFCFIRRYNNPVVVPEEKREKNIFFFSSIGRQIKIIASLLFNTHLIRNSCV